MVVPRIVMALVCVDPGHRNVSRRQRAGGEHTCPSSKLAVLSHTALVLQLLSALAASSSCSWLTFTPQWSMGSAANPLQGSHWLEYCVYS